MKGVNSQLQAYYAISMNNGITPEQLHDFVTVLETRCGQDVAGNAKAVLDELLTHISHE